MRTRYFIVTFLLWGWFSGYSQTLTLSACYEKAEKNYPLVAQTELIALSESYNLSNASRRWLPQFDLSGRATIQSEATKISISEPFPLEVDVLTKDQYQVLLTMNQTIWDGGQVRAAKQQIEATTHAQQKQNEVDMYAVRGRVNDIYFGIILVESQIEQLEVNLQELQRNYNVVESYVASGLANASDIDVVIVEQQQAQQQLTQLESMRTAYRTMLEAFIGEPIAESVVLERPPLALPSEGNHRVELQLFDANVALQEVQRAQLKAKNLPAFSLFAQAGYGQPGLNMFEPGFSPYGIAGVQMQWKFGNLYTLGNEKKMIENSVKMVEIQRATFLFNQNIQGKQLFGLADQYKKVLASDDEIIALRTRIYKASAVKTELGTQSVSDLMRDQNQEFMAKAQKIVHEIEYLKAIYDIKNLYNN